MLVVAQSTVGYAITQLSDGLAPQAAREAAIEAAAELEAVAAALRRLTRMGPSDRRRLAGLFVGDDAAGGGAPAGRVGADGPVLPGGRPVGGALRVARPV